MDVRIFAMWAVVGLVTGGLAGVVVKDGGYGLIGDLVLGLVGSIVGGWFFWAMEFSPGAGLFALVVVAFIGAASVIVAQRTLLCARV